jgi:hypothetical protein
MHKTFPLEPIHEDLDQALWQFIAENLENSGKDTDVEQVVEFGRTLRAARLDTHRSLARLHEAGLVRFGAGSTNPDFTELSGGDPRSHVALSTVGIADPTLPRDPLAPILPHWSILVSDPRLTQRGHLQQSQFKIDADDIVRFGKMRFPGKRHTFLAVEDRDRNIGLTTTRQAGPIRVILDKELKKVRAPVPHEGGDLSLKDARQQIKHLPDDLALLDLAMERLKYVGFVDGDWLYAAAKKHNIPGEAVSKVGHHFRRVKWPRCGYEWGHKHPPGYFSRIVAFEAEPL